MHFYGMSLSEYKKLSAESEEQLWLAITVIEARSMLVQFSCQDYPHMKPDKRRGLYNKLHRMAYPELYSSKRKVVSMEEFFAKMNKTSTRK